MPEAFADASFWIGLLNPRDQWHQACTAASQALGARRMVTTDDVLTEFLAYFSKRPLRVAGAKGVRRILMDPNIVVLPQTRVEFFAALERFEDRPDKEWSLVDCGSMLVMERRGMRDVLTTDDHFAQAGFNVLIDKNAS